MFYLKEHYTVFKHKHSSSLKKTRNIFFWATCPISCPCYCIFGCIFVPNFCMPTCGNWKAQKRREKARKRDRELSVIAQARRERRLSGRKRELSVVREGKSSRLGGGELKGTRQGRAKDERQQMQTQSLFLTKLPAEVRMMVYKRVLCESGRVHVWREGRGSALRGMICRSADGLGNCECVEDKDAKGPDIALLKTCRKIYREGINTLYANNTFAFWVPSTLTHFSRSILPQRLDQIRTIVFSHDTMERGDPHRLSDAGTASTGWASQQALSWLKFVRMEQPLISDQPLYRTVTSMKGLKRVVFAFSPSWVWFDDQCFTDLETLVKELGKVDGSTATFKRFLLVRDDEEEYVRDNLGHLLRETNVVRAGELVELR